MAGTGSNREGKFKCKVCRMNFESKEELKFHLMEDHSENWADFIIKLFEKSLDPGKPRSQIFVLFFLRASKLIFFLQFPYCTTALYAPFLATDAFISASLHDFLFPIFISYFLIPISYFLFLISYFPIPYSAGEHLMNSLAIIQQFRSGVPGLCSSEKAFTSTSLMVGWMTCDLVTGLRSWSSVFMR